MFPAVLASRTASRRFLDLTGCRIAPVGSFSCCPGCRQIFEGDRALARSLAGREELSGP